MSKLIYKELSDKVLQAAFTVHSSVGSGLLESVYQKALEVELEFLNIHFASQVPLRVFHRNKMVGDFFADIIVDGKIILELKAVKSINPAAEAQLLNYLSISGLSVGYLFNFRNTTLAWKRMVKHACTSSKRSTRQAQGSG
jgi:GxxExxY protein